MATEAVAKRGTRRLKTDRFTNAVFSDCSFEIVQRTMGK
jgi:hypothetical protein